MKFNEAMKRYQYKLKEMPYSKKWAMQFLFVNDYQIFAPTSQYCGPSKQKMQSEKCRIWSGGVFVWQEPLTGDWEIIVSSDINRYRICPHLIERRKF